jgi:hypothetical protein
MSTTEEKEDEILAVEMPAKVKQSLAHVLESTDYITTVLLAIEDWLRENDDDEGARIVERATLRMATHEAETT